MATKDIQRLEDRIASLETLLRRAGMPMPAEISEDPTQRPDYIEPGSDKHMAFLGLVEVTDPADEVVFEIWKSESGRKYRLVDPIGPYVGYADPKQASMVALRQKVASFESGPATVHDRAHELWVPEDLMPDLARLLRR